MKGNTLENEWLLLYFNGTTMEGIAMDDSSPVADSLYFRLHTAFPGETGLGSTSQAAYTGYAPVPVARDGTGFTVTANSVSPAANVEFGECTASPGNPLMFWSISRSDVDANAVDYYGPLGSRLGPFTALADNNVFIPGSSLSVDDRVCLTDMPGGTFPAGATAGTVYYVLTAPGSSVYTLSTSSGGGVLDISAAGSGYAWRVTPVTMAEGVIPRIKTTSTLVED